VQLSIISLPEGKDPDELIQKDVTLWQLATTKQQYAVDWLIDRYKTQFDIASSQGKKQFIDTIAKVIVRLQNPVEKDHYTQELAKITNVDKAAIIMTLKQISNKQPDLKKVNINPKQTKDNDYYQDNLLALLVGYSTTRRFLEKSDTSLFVFSTPERQRLFEYIQQFPNVSFAKEIPEDLKDIEDYAKIVLFKAEELYAPPRFNENSRLRELQDLIQKLKINYIKQQRQLISEEIKQAELAGDQQRVSELLASFIDLNKKG
ncbi:MAG: primase, partial [Patescibacteria group bacterium]|nr:primase [Patescibacteria group bacterium]